MNRKYRALAGASLVMAAGAYYAVSRWGEPASRQILGALGRSAVAADVVVNVLTGGYDNARTNANLSEAALTPATVKSGSFGKVFSLAVDGQIYAQPLYVQGVSIPGKGTHNVVIAATMHNTVYAFDAETPATPLWSVNLGPSVPTSSYNNEDGVYTDIQPENGILGTPAIDAATGTVYAVAATFENGKPFYRLHALDVGSGTEKFGGPAVITAQVTGTGDASVNGLVPFDAAQHLQRPALLLVNGKVYAAFGSHGDAAPFHGWIIGYNATNVQQQVSVFNATPNGTGGAFWQSGRGLSADDQGNIYAVSGNGDTDMTANFSDNVLRLDSTATKVADWFSPANVQDLNDSDDDLGTSGALLVPGTNFLVTGGKQGIIYLLDRSSLGHSASGDSQAAQRLDTASSLVFNFALWNRPDGPRLYTHTANAPITVYKLQGGSLGASPAAASANGFPVPYQGMTLSANGVQGGSGVLWVLAPTRSPVSPGVLHAYNADDLTEIWNSTGADADAPGGFVKFANPTVANGRVYVPTTSNQLVVYGLLGGGVSAVTGNVSGIVNAASYSNSPLAPGEIVAILGQGLGPQTPVAGTVDSNGILGGQLAGVQVTFNGMPGPLYSASDGTVVAIVPYEMAGSGMVTVVASYNGKSAPAQTMPVADTAPGLFASDASGSGPGAILNQDSTLNSPGNPAAAGSKIVVSATGGGTTNPPGPTGGVVTGDAPVAADVSATVGGETATVLYAGGSTGQVSGSMQLNLQLPAGVSGTVPVVVTMGGRSSQATVTVSIRRGK